MDTNRYVYQYAPTLFSQAGLDPGTASFLASGLSAILMLAVSIPASLLADSWGRRTSVLTGGIGLSACMFIIGSLYATDSVHVSDGAGRWFVIILIFSFALIYMGTWGVVGKIYASEVQPAKTRAAANSLAQGLNFVSVTILTVVTLPTFFAPPSSIDGQTQEQEIVVLTLFLSSPIGSSHLPHLFSSHNRLTVLTSCLGVLHSSRL